MELPQQRSFLQLSQLCLRALMKNYGFLQKFSRPKVLTFLLHDAILNWLDWLLVETGWTSSPSFLLIKTYDGDLIWCGGVLSGRVLYRTNLKLKYILK